MTSQDGAAGHRGADRQGDALSRQRFGHICPAAPEAGGSPDGYTVRDDETGRTYRFGPADIVTEGFRSIRAGERVRFLTSDATPGQASYVIRLDNPDAVDYY